MNFDSVNYSFLLQDFIFAMAAGFAVGGAKQFMAIFLPKGKKRLFVRDMLTAFLFAAAVFSFAVSFANYSDVRIYHILGALFGFLSFNFNFSTIFHKIFKKFFSKAKIKMLCYGKKVFGTICGLKQKINKSSKKCQQVAQNEDLKSENIWVYNL